MAKVINSARPWFVAKLTANAASVVSLAKAGLKTGTWSAWTGTASRATKAAYAGATVSGSYTQAEVQAISDAAKANAQAMKALIDDLQTAGILG